MKETEYVTTEYHDKSFCQEFNGERKPTNIKQRNWWDLHSSWSLRIINFVIYNFFSPQCPKLIRAQKRKGWTTQHQTLRNLLIKKSPAIFDSSKEIIFQANCMNGNVHISHPIIAATLIYPYFFYLSFALFNRSIDFDGFS